MHIIYSLIDGDQPLEKIITDAAAIEQTRQLRRQEIMSRKPILPRILARGVPEDKAAELTVRCLTNQEGPVERSADDSTTTAKRKKNK